MKRHAVENIDVMEEEEHDARYSPDEVDNNSQKYAMHSKRFHAALPDACKIVGKKELGLAWVKDVSSADGEPIIRDWFPVP